MYGLLLLPVAFYISSPALYAVGLGLFIDELPFLLLRGKTHQDNYSAKSLLGLFVCIALVYLIYAQVNF